LISVVVDYQFEALNLIPIMTLSYI